MDDEYFIGHNAEIEFIYDFGESVSLNFEDFIDNMVSLGLIDANNNSTLIDDVTGLPAIELEFVETEMPYDGDIDIEVLK